MKVSKELKTLLKIAKHAHPTLQAMLIDLNCYHPEFIIDEKDRAPEDLGFQKDIPDWESYG